MPKPKKVKIDIYKGKPWKNMDQYHSLVIKHHLGGSDLEKKLKNLYKQIIPMPVITPPLDK